MSIPFIRRIAMTQDAAARPSVTVSGAAAGPVQALVTAAEREVCACFAGFLEKFTPEFTLASTIAYDATILKKKIHCL